MKRVIVTLLLSAPLLASQPVCKPNPKVIGACYVVHGRLGLGGDTVTLRLWPVGTKRMLGATGGSVPDDAVDPICPSGLKLPSESEVIYGDFEVCPFTQDRKGAMQMVCIESASR